MGGSESSLKKRGGWLLKRKSAPTDKGVVDLTRSIRDYLESLNREQLMYLASTYATLSTERVYYTAAMKARPLPASIYQDFSDLLDYKYNSDVEIQLPAANFLAHKPILMARSGYFAAHLKSGSVKLSILDVLGFSEVLRWIYTGDSAISAADTAAGPLPGFLHLTPSSLPASLLQLYTTRRYADCLLIWSSTCTQPAHVCVLSARSPLLRTLLSKKKQLVLDSSVIPFKYSNCILFFMYTDQLDLSLISDTPTAAHAMPTMAPPPFPGSSSSSLTQGAGATGSAHADAAASHHDLITHLQELYYCGQFLELDALSHAIESVLEAHINQATWVRILQWANESFGSPYVRRCCLLYMQEYWWHIAQRTEFYTVPTEAMEELIQSDFTQCPESELVDSVLRWAQYNGVNPLPPQFLSALRLDYITNTALLKQVTRGMNPSPSLLLQSRPRYWAPIHIQLVDMVGDQIDGVGAGGVGALGLVLEPLDDFQLSPAGGQGNGAQAQAEEEGINDIIIEPEVFTQLVQKYDQLQTDTATPPSDNICHWLRLQALRECGLPDTYEKCLISSLAQGGPDDDDPDPSLHEHESNANAAHVSPDSPRAHSHSAHTHSHSHRRAARARGASSHGGAASTGTASLRRRGAGAQQLGGPSLLMERPQLPDIASNIIDPIVNLDLGDRFKH